MLKSASVTMATRVNLKALTAARCAIQKPMNRRVDQRTAELVEIALLTRAAFQQEEAHRYAGVAGLPDYLTAEIFARPSSKVRQPTISSCFGTEQDRRRYPRM